MKHPRCSNSIHMGKRFYTQKEGSLQSKSHLRTGLIKIAAKSLSSPKFPHVRCLQMDESDISTWLILKVKIPIEIFLEPSGKSKPWDAISRTGTFSITFPANAQMVFLVTS